MSRRDAAKREKLRAEEKELDKQLQDAGFDMQGVSFEEKKAIFAMLEESRKSAQEEENQRKQWQESEDIILKETLNKSSHMEEVNIGKVANNSDENEENVVSGNSSKTLSNEGCEVDCNSDSRSLTPDLLSQLPKTPSKSTEKQFGSPIQSSSNSCLLSRQSPRISEDLFMFSQSSAKLGVDENVIKNCIETIKVSESESEDEDSSCSPIKSCSRLKTMPCSPSVKTQKQSPQTLSDITRINDSCAKSPISSISPVKARPSFRRYQSEGTVPSPNSKSQEPEIESYSASQPSAGAKNLRLSRLIDDKDKDSIISPVVGRRKLLLGNEKLPQNKDKTIEVSEISHVGGIKVIPASPEPMSDEETSDTELFLPTKKLISNKDESKVQLSLKNRTYKREVPQNRLKRKLDVIESDEMDSPEQYSESLRKDVKCVDKQPIFQGLSLSDSEEESVEQNKKEGKDFNVFFTDKNDVTLKRKFGKLENPEKTYFRNCDETPSNAYKRILNLINQYFLTLESHQKTLSSRMPWPAAIKVDKRVKDSLEPPKVSRRQIEDLQTNSDEEALRMVTRHSQRKNLITVDEESSVSDEMPPENGDNSGIWLDAQKKNSKRRALQLSSSRKMNKLSHDEEIENRHNVGVIKTSIISELDDFDFSSTRVPRLSPAVKQKEMPSELRQSPSFKQKGIPTVPRLSPSVKGIATPVKNSEIECRKTSSKTESGQTNFDIGEILLNSQESDHEKDKKLSSKENHIKTTIVSEFDVHNQPSTSGVKNSSKRPRKTFRLTIDSDDELSQSNENANTLLVKSKNIQISGHTPPVKSIDKAHEIKGKDNSDVIIRDSSDFTELSQEADSKKVIDTASSVRLVDSITRQGKTKQVKIKPGPLRLKTQGGRRRGKVAAMATNRSESEDSIELPNFTSSEMSQQVPNSQEEVLECADDRVECPLCLKSFPSNVIEAHASNCGEMGIEEDPVPPPSQIKGNRRQVVRKDGKEVSSNEEVLVSKVVSRKNKRARTPPHFARCVHCNSVIKEGDEYLIHVQDCQKKIEESCEMSPRIRTPKREQNGTSFSNMRVTRPLMNEVSSVFDQLEG
ncbi:uro-adherence factor A-like isoform X2 [Palaemon carinicauda]|uniref:uro-adherence factor A-like isoform X2 n=1 Tax=Palaemon carinicauda TaxID=392227 RepID=UPI0035B5F487